MNYDDLKIREEEAAITEAQHEKEMTRMETVNKRWFITFMVLLILFFATNAGWIAYENQFKDVEIASEIDTGENSTVVGIGVIGDVTYGESEANN